ncbi:hypothetical protein [Nocardioides sp. YIM 152588]|uniref:hypothetical protein n=1 Tax=Nocardioides sp. YIM 152588 TaxID=3158259 RepID=UPI0032E3AE84
METRPTRRPPLAVAAAAVGLLALAGALGALGGRLWWAWWSPATPGQVYATSDGLAWYPDPADPGFAHAFAGTAQFVVIGFVAGVLLGVVGGVVTRNRPLVGLGIVAVAALVGLLLTYRVGIAASPPDPTTLLGGAEAGDLLPANLQVSGWTPYLAWPVGAFFGFLLVMVTIMSSDRAAETASAVEPAESVEPAEADRLRVRPGRSEPSPRP